MLHDPDPMTLPKLTAWLEAQPPEQSYNYYCNGGCLLARYVVSCGYTGAWVGGFDWRPNGRNKGNIEDLPWIIANTSSRKPWTYGAALARCREAQAKGLAS